MSITYVSILGLIILLNLFVFWRMYVLLGATRRPRLWRIVLSLMAFIALAFCTTGFIAIPILGGTRNPLPRWLVASLYIWHFLALPIMAISLLIDLLIRSVRKIWIRLDAAREIVVQSTPAPMLSRRNFLTAVGMTAVPAATVSLGGVAMTQLGKFRIKTYDLPISGWPGELDGYTISVVADVHAGAFSTPKMLDDILDATNRLGSDLILLAGDLINVALYDLPSALDMVLNMEARDGVYMIQGNHDCIQGPDHFDNAVRRRGIKLLVDEAATISARVPFQVLGTRWTSDQHRDESVAYTAGLRNPGMFALMLAHHPHSWDVAAACGIPLVISGHTHGGQIMLTNRIGGGPLRFKYWSGQYDMPGSTLIVSNGVGNWFPLRVNAPAEILKIIMHPRA